MLSCIVSFRTRCFYIYETYLSTNGTCDKFGVEYVDNIF